LSEDNSLIGVKIKWKFLIFHSFLYEYPFISLRISIHFFCTDLFTISWKLSMANYLVSRSKDGWLEKEIYSI